MPVVPESLGEQDSHSVIMRVLSELWICLPTLCWRRKWVKMRGGDGDAVAVMMVMDKVVLSMPARLNKLSKNNVMFFLSMSHTNYYIYINFCSQN